MSNYTLYALTDSQENIRYIGYTSNKINNRLSEHIKSSFNDREKNCHRCKWIRSLIKNNEKPLIKELTIVKDLNSAKLLEIELIQHYRQFVKLTNNTNGGDGTKGLKWSEESKARIKGRKINRVELKVEGINLKTGEHKIFNTTKEAADYINCYVDSIRMVCRNERSSVFKWKLSYVKEGAQQS